MKRFFALTLTTLLASFVSAQTRIEIAKPSEVSLGSLIRTENINTPLGVANIRWARSAEALFGKAPERAVVDALTTVKKVSVRLSTKLVFTEPGFKWDIVIMDEKVPEKEIPKSLVNDCHPAWMVPPSNIYVVAQRVVTGCSGRRAEVGSGDAKLARVLIHEIGHVLEFALLQQGVSGRVIAEGFATWFESYAASYSSMLSQSAITTEHRMVAKMLLGKEKISKQFDGTYEDYVLASLPFYAIESRRGITGVEDFYKELVKTKDYYKALSNVLGWSEKKLSEEVLKWMEH